LVKLLRIHRGLRIAVGNFVSLIVNIGKNIAKNIMSWDGMEMPRFFYVVFVEEVQIIR
jgi:hypothetical protein